MTEKEKREEVIKWLLKLAALKKHIEKLKDDYNDIIEHAEGKPITYDKDFISPTNAFNSQTENKAMDLYILSSRIKQMEDKINKLEGYMNIIAVQAQQILQYRHMQEPMTWEIIADKVGYSSKQCQRIYKEAMDTLETIILGE